MQMYFVNMAGALDVFFFMLSLLSLFFLVNISKHLRIKGSTFYSWAVKRGTAKNGLTIYA